MPIVEVIRVIDWRHAGDITGNARTARQVTEASLRPYIGQVDLIIFANYLLSLTSLRYFKRRYPEQKFLGLYLASPRPPYKRKFLVLTTRAVSQTLHYHNFRYHLGLRTKTLRLDAWPEMIDNGELTGEDVATVLKTAAVSPKRPRDVVLASSQFRDLKPELDDYFRGQVKIYDGFEDAVRRTCQVLKIRGGATKKWR